MSRPRYFVAIAEHSRCQPGRPLPHGVSHDGSPGFALFQSAKSSGRVWSRRRSHPVASSMDPVPTRAIRRERSHRKIDVAINCVRMAGVDQSPHQHDHLGHVPGCAGCNSWRQAPQRRIRLVEQPLVPLGHRPPWHPGGRRSVENLVVDVSDVAAQGDVVSVRRKPTNQDVESHRRAHVTDVWWRLHGRTAQIQRHLARHDRHERTRRPARGVVEAQIHPARLVRGYPDPS